MCIYISICYIWEMDYVLISAGVNFENLVQVILVPIHSRLIVVYFRKAINIHIYTYLGIGLFVNIMIYIHTRHFWYTFENQYIYIYTWGLGSDILLYYYYIM